MKRSHIFLVAAALATLLLVPMASADTDGTDRPFEATLSGAATFVVPSGCPPDCELFTTHGDLTGEATHMGRVVVHMSHHPYDFDNPLDGEMTITAANGDKLYAEYDYDLFSEDPDQATVITGGTGRFIHASGSVDITYEVIPQFKPSPCDPDDDPFGCLNPDVPWPWSGTMTGTISY